MKHREAAQPPDVSLLSDTHYHVYAIEWEENEIRWYFDDQQFFKITPEDVRDEWIFDHPFFIILNLAVGWTTRLIWIF